MQRDTRDVSSSYTSANPAALLTDATDADVRVAQSTSGTLPRSTAKHLVPRKLALRSFRETQGVVNLGFLGCRLLEVSLEKGAGNSFLRHPLPSTGDEVLRGCRHASVLERIGEPPERLLRRHQGGVQLERLRLVERERQQPRTPRPA